MYDLIDYQREERERWNEPTEEELVMMRNEEIEQAVEYFLYAIAQGWDKLTAEEEQMIHTYKDDPYFEELIREAGIPEIKYTAGDRNKIPDEF